MFNRGDVFVFIMMVGKCFFVGRMQSSYYARLRRKMNLDKKKRGVDSFNGASPSQDIVNSCKLKSTCPDKMFCTRSFFYKASFFFKILYHFFYCQLPTIFYFLLICRQMIFLIVFCHNVKF
jgi:hypothetical protein